MGAGTESVFKALLFFFLLHVLKAVLDWKQTVVVERVVVVDETKNSFALR